jgi:hypothetical protein
LGAAVLFVVDQEKKKVLPISVTELRAESYSTDGNVVISFRTKYSTNEWKYSIPIECLRDLIIDLKRLNLAPPTQPDKPTEQPQTLLPEVSIISE